MPQLLASTQGALRYKSHSHIHTWPVSGFGGAGDQTTGLLFSGRLVISWDTSDPWEQLQHPLDKKKEDNFMTMIFINFWQHFCLFSCDSPQYFSDINIQQLPQHLSLPRKLLVMFDPWFSGQIKFFRTLAVAQESFDRQPSIPSLHADVSMNVCESVNVT